MNVPSGYGELGICPSCGVVSATCTTTRSGFCKPCELLMRLSEVYDEAEDAIDALPMGQRAEAEMAFKEYERRTVAEPPKPPRAQDSRRRRDAAYRKYVIDYEQWRIDGIEAQLKAARQKLHRLQAKTKEEADG